MAASTQLHPVHGLLIISPLVEFTQGCRTSRRHMPKNLFQGIGLTIVRLAREVQNPKDKERKAGTFR